MLLQSLTPEVRGFMLREVELDAGDGQIFLSPRLSHKGRFEYPDLLRRAVTSEHVAWLTSELNAFGRLERMEQRRKPSGGFTMAKVPYNAAEIIAEGEFNRFYIRGLCLFKLETGAAQALVAYRAKRVMTPRPGSEARIGLTFPAESLLADLRRNAGVETALGIPGGPCSGISVRLT